MNPYGYPGAYPGAYPPGKFASPLIFIHFIFLHSGIDFRLFYALCNSDLIDCVGGYMPGAYPAPGVYPSKSFLLS
jgi:hypothetical protein